MLLKSREESLRVNLPTVLVLMMSACVQPSLAREPQDQGATPSTPPAILGKIDLSPTLNGLHIEVETSVPIVPTSERLTNPDRLVFDFPGCQLQGANRHVPVNSGPVRELRLSQFSLHPPVTRVVVDSRAPLDFEVKPSGNKVVIDISFPKASASVPSTPPAPSVDKEHAAPVGTVKQHTTPTGTSARASGASAYSLQAKARALNVEDLQALEDKAEAGDPEAETTLALAYHAGVLLKQSDADALRLLHKAADRGYRAAQESLGIFSETGIGEEQPDPAKALEWYKKAVQQGSLDAATNIGLMYARGRGVPKNSVEASTWLRKAAEGGDAIAQYNLALLYGRGDGVPKNDKESRRWLTAAAEQNVIPALLDLANFYLNPPASTEPDVEHAIPYLEKAAGLDNAHAQAMLGTIFARGVQGKPDYEQSVNWYRKAAEHGDPDGECGLAIRYALGQGVPVDLEEARRLFKAAADRGQLEAQYDLAVMSEEGKGGPADQQAAAHYFQLAAEQGASKAQFRLGRLLAGIQKSPGDRVKAYQWLMLAQDSIKESSAALSDLRKSMTEQEITEAERGVDAWRIAHKTVHQ